MRLIDRLFGTRHPEPHVTPVAAEQLRATLLGLNHPARPWFLTDGTHAGVDLVASWNVDLPPWGTLGWTVLMRLDGTRHEVRALEQSRERDIDGTTFGQGPVNERAVNWTLERDQHGRRHWVRGAGFDSRDLKDPLRDTVTGAGWTWKGVAFRLRP